MAEVGILIIFVLLLLIGLRDLRERQARQDAASVPRARLAALEEDSSALATMRSELQAANVPPEDITRLVRVIQEASDHPDSRTAMAEARSTLAEMRRAQGALRRALQAAEVEGAESIPAEFARQAFQLANQEGQLQYYEKKLKAAGQGKGERPCWVQPNGTIDYLYDVVLASGGIRVREYSHPARAQERDGLPMPSVSQDEILSESMFLARTQRLFAYSQQQNCRFFVVVYDATQPHEKPLYKRLLRAVEGHFYKRLSDDPAPF